jgi:hypothetical protein
MVEGVNGPEFTGDESDEEFEQKLDALDRKLDKMEGVELPEQFYQHGPGPCATCGETTPYRCKKCNAPICRAHFARGRIPMCKRCYWKWYGINMGFICLGTIVVNILTWGPLGH